MKLISSFQRGTLLLGENTVNSLFIHKMKIGVPLSSLILLIKGSGFCHHCVDSDFYREGIEAQGTDLHSAC